jgi:5-dehydro-2-deoxygluconokinase
MQAEEPLFDLVTMGRSSIDLYSNDIGAPFVEIKSFAAYVGGSPTNIAVAARRLNVRTALLTAVGPDPVGDFILHFLEREDVETRFIPRKPGTRSSAVILGIEPPDRFPLVFYRDNAADIRLTIDDVRAAPIDRCRAFEFAGTNLSREPSRSATFYAVERARGGGAVVFCDLDFRFDQWDDPLAYGANLRAILAGVDAAIGTEEEVLAAMLSDPGQVRVRDSQVSAPEIAGDVDAAVGALLEMGPETLVIKRGARGATVHERDAAPVDVPGFAVEVVNVLGAGDAFAGGLIYGRLKGWDWYRAARMGNACGAIVVTRHGCANFMATEAEALQFIGERGGF